MKVIKNNNRIFLSDWQKYKPKAINSKTDIYYLNICNKVFEALKNTKNQTIFQKLSLSEVKELCCFLTTYFEDIISEKCWLNRRLHFSCCMSWYVCPEINVSTLES